MNGFTDLSCPLASIEVLEPEHPLTIQSMLQRLWLITEMIHGTAITIRVKTIMKRIDINSVKQLIKQQQERKRTICSEERFMKAILSADLNWGIGCDGKLLQRVPEDMKRFMHMTTGKIVVMGRETFESLPGKQPLKDRVNIVLSRKKEFGDERFLVCRSLKELFKLLSSYDMDDVFVTGGEAIYIQLLPYCSIVYLTRFEKEFEADRHFPDLDKMDNWELVSQSEQKVYQDMGFRYLDYRNNDVKPFPC